jgi:hypothetical protein
MSERRRDGDISDDPRLCKDCRFQRSLNMDLSPFFWVCEHPAMALAPKIDLLTGAHTPPAAMTCQEGRAFQDLCGKAGRYWEPRGFV